MQSAPVVLGCVCVAMVLHPERAGGQVARRDSTTFPVEYTVPPLAPEAGARAGYDWGLESWSVGAQFRLAIVPGLYLIPSGDYYLRAPGAQWQVNLDVAFRLFWFAGVYGGAGLGLAHRASASGGTRTGLNVFAGFTPPRLTRRLLWPFIEARWLLVQNRSPFALQAGFSMPLER